MGPVGDAPRFLLAHLIGSTFAALMMHFTVSPSEFSLQIILGIALLFMFVGLVPALVAGVGALMILRELDAGRPLATLVMALGGAGIGAFLTSIIAHGMEDWGAMAGGSIGLVQGLMLYRDRHASS